MIRQGKSGKDRLVALGARATTWIERYLDRTRPKLLLPPDDGTVFLTTTGESVTPNRLSQLVRDFVRKADLAKIGACHLFRHTAAVLVLENTVRHPAFAGVLGHAELTTTAIYTHIAIRKLLEVHRATHP